VISKRLAVRRVLLGCLVMWQLLFVVQSNCYDLIQSLAVSDSENSTAGKSSSDASPDSDWLSQASAGLRELTAAYEQLTGQEQGWALFWKPKHDIGFVAVELRWDNASSGVFSPGPRHVLLLSNNEPRSVSSYFRSSHFRLRRVESELEIDNLSAAAIERHVRTHGDLILAYLQWRLRQFGKDSGHSVLTGGIEPTQVILVFRRYRIRTPDSGPAYVQGPVSVPVACWRPHAHAEEGFLRMESYDLSSKQFIRLRVHE
jgi:hypothetical protein